MAGTYRPLLLSGKGSKRSIHCCPVGSFPAGTIPKIGSHRISQEYLKPYFIDFKYLYNSLSVERMMDVFSSKVFSKVSIDFRKAYRSFELADWLYASA